LQREENQSTWRKTLVTRQEPTRNSTHIWHQAGMLLATFDNPVHANCIPIQLYFFKDNLHTVKLQSHRVPKRQDQILVKICCRVAFSMIHLNYFLTLAIIAMQQLL